MDTEIELTHCDQCGRSIDVENSEHHNCQYCSDHVCKACFSGDCCIQCEGTHDEYGDESESDSSRGAEDDPHYL